MLLTGVARLSGRRLLRRGWCFSAEEKDLIGSKLPPTLRYAIRSVGGSLLPNSTERSDITHTKDFRPVLAKKGECLDVSELLAHCFNSDTPMLASGSFIPHRIESLPASAGSYDG